MDMDNGEGTDYQCGWKMNKGKKSDNCDSKKNKILKKETRNYILL